MIQPAVFEPLERRDNFAAAATGLDADYGIPTDAIRRAVGDNVSIYQALPAPGDRTFLLAERYADPTDNDSTGYLTIIALDADGQLDPSFGTDGIALTGRVTQTHSPFDRSGLLERDDGGRLYFADDTRVLRFHADGTTDKSFGTRGAATFASADQQVALCDIQPVDGGVLVATTKTKRGVQYFAVQRVGRTVKTTFSATHDTGQKSVNKSGTLYMGRQELMTDAVQFAKSPGGLVLARIETDNTTYQQHATPDDDDPTAVYTNVGVKEQNVVVTRLDAAGRGSDVIRKPMRRRAEYEPATFGNQYSGSTSFFDNSNLLLTGNARFLLVQTDQEVMRLDLKRDTVQRYSIPPALYENFNPTYQLLGDGALYAIDQTLGHNFEPVTAITRYGYDGVLDKTFGKNGVLTLNPPDTTPGVFTDQLFLGTSGRLYLLNKRGSYGVSSLSVQRVDG